MVQTQDYIRQAEVFLENWGARFQADYICHDKYFPDDCESRSIWQITIRRDGKNPWSFRFGQSIADSYSQRKHHPPGGMAVKEAPRPYDVLACIEKNEIGTFSDFCSEFGYNEDSRKTFDLYLRVQKEYAEFVRMFPEEMAQTQAQEIA